MDYFYSGFLFAAVCQSSSSFLTVKNELGMVTVKRQVAQNEPGNLIVGLVYGNHPTELNKAKDDADLCTNKFWQKSS